MKEEEQKIEFHPYENININFKSKYVFLYYENTKKDKIFSFCQLLINKYKNFGIIYTNRGILINLEKVNINKLNINDYDNIINNGIIAIKNELIEYIY